MIFVSNGVDLKTDARHHSVVAGLISTRHHSAHSIVCEDVGNLPCKFVSIADKLNNPFSFSFYFSVAYFFFRKRNASIESQKDLVGDLWLIVSNYYA